MNTHDELVAAARKVAKRWPQKKRCCLVSGVDCDCDEPGWEPVTATDLLRIPNEDDGWPDRYLRLLWNKHGWAIEKQGMFWRASTHGGDGRSGVTLTSTMVMALAAVEDTTG